MWSSLPTSLRKYVCRLPCTTSSFAALTSTVPASAGVFGLGQRKAFQCSDDVQTDLPLEVHERSRRAHTTVSVPAQWSGADSTAEGGHNEPEKSRTNEPPAALSLAETVTAMHEAGILLVPGTDMGGSFVYHRELELYQQVGMTAPEILAWASPGMAEYVGQSDELGSIAPGKLADFFLVPGDPTADLKAIKTISMVVKDGTVYFPSEIYPSFGIEPFAAAPTLTE